MTGQFRAPGGTTTHAATWQGAAAIAIWASLASLTALSGSLPPFQMTAMSFTIATLIGLVHGLATGIRPAAMFVMPIGAFLLGVAGLTGYHATYFFALKTAPPLEATIISYLWPLLIVLFTGLLPAGLGGGRLGWRVALGAVIAAAGAMTVVAANTTVGPTLSGKASGYATVHIAGYLAALASAVIWAAYSVATRLYARVPTSAMTGICAATALAAGLLHVATEVTHWPLARSELLAVSLAGLGPVGAAFYLWDAGMKRGNIRLLAVLSYTTPILSTLMLAALGIGRLTPAVALAVLAVTIGAVLAAADARRKARSNDNAPTKAGA